MNIKDALYYTALDYSSRARFSSSRTLIHSVTSCTLLFHSRLTSLWVTMCHVPVNVGMWVCVKVCKRKNFILMKEHESSLVPHIFHPFTTHNHLIMNKGRRGKKGN